MTNNTQETAFQSVQTPSLQDEPRYRQIFEAFVDLYYEIDMTETIQVLSPSVFSLTGWRPEELVGRPVRDIYYNPDDRTPLLNALFTTGSVQNYIVLLKNKAGTPISASISARVIQDHNGHPTGVSGTIRDMTESIRTQEALRESEEKFRTLAESSPFAIMIYQDNRWIYANPAAETMCGYTADELCRMNFWDFVHPDDLPLVQERGKARQSGQQAQQTYEFRIIAKDGIEKWVILNGASIVFQGRSAGLISVFDITDRKQAEQDREKLQNQLRQSQKLESVGLLAGGVAHDLNNLLQPILGYAELLLMDGSSGETGKRYVQQIIGTVERARDLLRQLMAFGRKQILEIQPLDINQVITDFSRLLRRTLREDIRFALIPGPQPGMVSADKSQIEQILMNLTVNAQDAMPDGGNLTIETKPVSLDAHVAARIPEIVPGRYVCLMVSDTGIGMDTKTAQQIFDPFFTTKEMGKGTGLGLSTVYGIVRQHGGHIQVYSEPNQGTVFQVYFPVSREDATTEPRSKTGHEPIMGGHETILVAEDEAIVRDLTHAMLSQLGYRVLIAETAKDCLYLAKAHRDSIDLLLTDVVMPEMSGKELHAQIAHIKPDIRVLFMSGYTADIIAHRGVLDEGVQFIQKPFSLTALAEKIRHVLTCMPGL
ncbi:MAG: PAS domain S-box protein [Desulfatirhabdiaceae bacterium]